MSQNCFRINKTILKCLPLLWLCCLNKIIMVGWLKQSLKVTNRIDIHFPINEFFNEHLSNPGCRIIDITTNHATHKSVDICLIKTNWRLCIMENGGNSLLCSRRDKNNLEKMWKIWNILIIWIHPSNTMKMNMAEQLGWHWWGRGCYMLHKYMGKIGSTLDMCEIVKKQHSFL